MRQPTEAPGTDLDFLGYRGVSLHPYPATMPYPLAKSLVLSYSEKGEVVLDPFVGSGTTAWAAATYHRRAIGVDMNPLATLIARVSVAPFDLDRDIAVYDGARLRVLTTVTKAPAYPSSIWQSRLETWFVGETIEALAKLAGALRETRVQPRIYDFLLLAFSRTVRKCSLARRGELKLWRRDGHVRWEEPWDVFSREANQLLWSLVSLHAQRPIDPAWQPRIVTADAESALGEISSVDLVLTSPPYGDAWTTVAYGNFSLLSRIWLSAVDEIFVENDPASEDERSLGGSRRSRDFDISELLSEAPALQTAYTTIGKRSDQRAAQLLAFYADMRVLLARMTGSLTPKGKIVLVMGPRRMAGTWLDSGRILGELLGMMGVRQIKRETRRISGKRLPQKTVQGPSGLAETINRETIDVFARFH